jgi:hypothetical protein
LILVRPSVRVTVESCVRDGDAWLVGFLVSNAGPSTLSLVSAWVPHGRFRGADGRTPLDVHLAPGASHALAVRVLTCEPPGTVVENAFLILQAERWRIFTRMRIEFSPEPVPIVEQVTLQPIES